MKKLRLHWIVLGLMVMVVGCGGGGGDTVVVTNTTPNSPIIPALMITYGAVSADGLSREVFIDSPLLQDPPVTEPNKVVGLMDEAVQITGVIRVCWEGDKAGWNRGLCTTAVRQGNDFHVALFVPIRDEGNFVADLVPSPEGSESWLNITRWTWPSGTVLDLKRGTAKLP